jgi:Outer membrane protein beta-barrel domain
MSLRKSLLILLIFTSIQTSAQVVWGLKGGFNVTTLGTSSQYQPRLGYHLGTYYSQHIEDQYGWQIGLQYSLQGARVANGINGSRLSYHYISVPLLMKFYFSGNLYADVGPQVGYLLKAQYKESGFAEDKTSSVQPWDILGLVGFGSETNSGGSMGLRFGVGFTNPSGASVGNEFVPRNLIFQAYIGFVIKEFDR